MRQKAAGRAAQATIDNLRQGTAAVESPASGNDTWTAWHRGGYEFYQLDSEAASSEREAIRNEQARTHARITSIERIIRGASSWQPVAVPTEQWFFPQFY